MQSGKDNNKSNISGTGFFLKPPLTRIWKFNTEAAFSINSLSASDGVLFACCLNGDIFAINIYRGSGIGKINTKSKSSSATPLITKELIVLTYGSGIKNFIAGYDYTSGEFKWKNQTDETLSSPISNGSNFFYSTTKGNIFCADIKRGKRVWSFKNKHSFCISPTMCNDILIIGDVKGNILALNAENGELKWSFKAEDGIYSENSVYGEKIFFGSDDRNFYCIDTTGRLIWKKNLGTRFLSSSTFYNSDVICTGINGKIYSINRETGVVSWEYETGGTITASPVINGNKIFIGSYDMYFYCIDADKGVVLWKYEFDERIRTSALIWQKYLVIACDDKSLYCFE